MHIYLQQNAAQESVGDMRDTSQLTISHYETALMQSSNPCWRILRHPQQTPSYEEHQELWNQEAQETSLTS
jgi:hypothetical protein